MGLEDHESLEHHEAGIEKVMAILAKQYITDHTVNKDGRKFYKGELHVLRWYQTYDHKQHQQKDKDDKNGTTKW